MDELKQEIAKWLPIIAAFFTAQAKADFVDTPNDRLELYHFGLGMWIRNNVLFENSVLCNMFAANGIADRDDMSMFIVRELQKVCGERK